MLSKFYGTSYTSSSFDVRDRGLRGEDSYVPVPFNELTKMLADQSKLLTISMQQNTSLAKLCEEMKGDMTKLRREVTDLKETFNSKVDAQWIHAKKNGKKKLPLDLTVRFKICKIRCLYKYILL